MMRVIRLARTSLIMKFQISGTQFFLIEVHKERHSYGIQDYKQKIRNISI